MFRESDFLSLALLFHLNSHPRARLQDPSDLWAGIGKVPPEVSYESTSLPPITDETGLLSMLGNRQSCRAFKEAAIRLEELGQLLHSSYGMLGTSLDASVLNRARRPVPSAGAVYPFDLFVLAHSVVGLRQGLHVYRPTFHALDMVRDVSATALRSLMLEAADVSAAGAAIVLAVDFTTTLRTYGPRGYRYLLLEAGHIAQNICLSAAEQGLGSLCIGGFRDSEMATVLRLDPLVSGVLYCIAIGAIATST